jgi:microcystin-dependent protein
VPNAPAQVAVNSSAAGTTTSANSTGISLTDNGHIHTSANTGSNTAHNTMHPYIVLNKIIKT